MLILRNCKLVDFLTEGYDGRTADILCDGEKIVRIAPVGTDFEAQAEELDVRGKTVLPGLIDMHCHLFLDNMQNALGGNLRESRLAYAVYEYAQVFLNSGYTTVRDCGDMPSLPAMYLKKEIDAGRLTGPRITTSGPILEGTYIDKWFHIGADGPYEMRKLVRKTMNSGADFIKLYGSGSLLFMMGETGFPTCEPDEVEEAVKIAHRWGTYVAVHAHGTTAIDICAKRGVHTLEHATLISEETLKYLDTLPYGQTGIVPTFTPFASINPDTPVGARMKTIKDQYIRNMKNAYENHNVLTGFGSDEEMKNFSKDPMLEFRLRKEFVGYSNEDILKQATINSAKLMYKENEIGSVKEGKYADFCIVDGDPVSDISVMYTKPCHVIKGGKVIR